MSKILLRCLLWTPVIGVIAEMVNDSDYRLSDESCHLRFILSAFWHAICVIALVVCVAVFF